MCVYGICEKWGSSSAITTTTTEHHRTHSVTLTLINKMCCWTVDECVQWASDIWNCGEYIRFSLSIFNENNFFNIEKMVSTFIFRCGDFNYLFFPSISLLSDLVHQIGKERKNHSRWILSAVLEKSLYVCACACVCMSLLLRMCVSVPLSLSLLLSVFLSLALSVCLCVFILLSFFVLPLHLYECSHTLKKRRNSVGLQNWFACVYHSFRSDRVDWWRSGAEPRELLVLWMCTAISFELMAPIQSSISVYIRPTHIYSRKTYAKTELNTYRHEEREREQFSILSFIFAD